MKKRKHIPLAARLEAALRQLSEFLGCAPDDLDLDHDPALNFRPMNKDGSDTIPPANDPANLIYRARADHKAKTFGPGGEKRIHTRGSDVSEPRRLDRLSEKHKAFRARALAVDKTAKPASKWPKRKFRRS